MFRLTAMTKDAGAVALPHLIATTPEGLDFDLGEVTTLREIIAEIHDLDTPLWHTIRDYAQQEMGTITATIAARLAAEPGYEDVAANPANSHVTFRYQGLRGEVYYQHHPAQMAFTLAGIHYAEISLTAQRYDGAAIAETVITTLAAMPTYPEATEEELTPTAHEKKAAGAIIKLLRSSNELGDPHLAAIFASALYMGKPIRVTALVIELLRRWLPDVGVIRKDLRHATHNRQSTRTGKLFMQWFVAYGQFVAPVSSSEELPAALTSVFLNAEAGNESA